MLPTVNFRNPMSIYLEVNFEPQYAKRSTDYLREYNPDSVGLKKARAYWLDLQKYTADPQKRERIWEEYPNEVRSVRSLIGIIHRRICTDAVINCGYYRHPRANDADPMSADFSRLEDYSGFESCDALTADEHEALIYFLGSGRDDRASYALTRHGLNEIQRIYPHRVDDLKKLLWQRHIVLEEHRKTISDQFLLQTINKLKTQKPWVIAITAISLVAAIVFGSIAFACAHPFLLIPAAIAVVITTVTPSIYIYRRFFYECE